MKNRRCLCPGTREKHFQKIEKWFVVWKHGYKLVPKSPFVGITFATARTIFQNSICSDCWDRHSVSFFLFASTNIFAANKSKNGQISLFCRKICHFFWHINGNMDSFCDSLCRTNIFAANKSKNCPFLPFLCQKNDIFSDTKTAKWTVYGKMTHCGPDWQCAVGCISWTL